MGHMAFFRVNATFTSPSRQPRKLVPLARGEAPLFLPFSCHAAATACLSSLLPQYGGEILPCAAWPWPLTLVCNRSGQPPAADAAGQRLAQDRPENIDAQHHDS